MASHIYPLRAALVVAALYTGHAGAAEPTTFSLRTYVETDDNVAFAADDAFAGNAESSTGVGVMLTVGRTLYRSDTLQLRGSMSAFHTQQLKSDAEDFNVTAALPRLSLTQRMRLAGKPATLSASFSLRRDWLGGEGFSRLIDLGGSVLVNVTPAWSIGPSYSVSQRNYDDEGFDPATTSRNALRHTLGLTTQWLLPSPVGSVPTRLALNASAQRNDADGKDFEFAGAVFGATLDLPLTARSASTLSDLGLQLAVSAVNADYDDFVDVPKRSDRRLAATLAVGASLKAIGRLDFSYARFAIDSNRPEFEASRNLLRLGITHSF